MTDVSNAALLQAYKDAIEANEDGIAKLLKIVILELMGGEKPSMVTISNDGMTVTPYAPLDMPKVVPTGKEVTS